MPAGSDLRETFPSRSFLLVGAGSFMLGGAAWYPSGWGVKLASAGIGVLLGILAAAALRRRPALLRPGSAKKSDFWAWNALAVASGVLPAANVPHVGPWFLGIAAGLFFVVASPPQHPCSADGRRSVAALAEAATHRTGRQSYVAPPSIHRYPASVVIGRRP